MKNLTIFRRKLRISWASISSTSRRSVEHSEEMVRTASLYKVEHRIGSPIIVVPSAKLQEMADTKQAATDTARRMEPSLNGWTPNEAVRTAMARTCVKSFPGWYGLLAEDGRSDGDSNRYSIMRPPISGRWCLETSQWAIGTVATTCSAVTTGLLSYKRHFRTIEPMRNRNGLCAGMTAIVALYVSILRG